LLRHFSTGILTGNRAGLKGKISLGEGQHHHLDFSGSFLIVKRQIKKKEGNFMKRSVLIVGMIVLAVTFAFVQASWAYQVTGPVVEVKDDSITVKKGSENWKIAKDKNT
jgi:hypothetical protein